MNKFNKDDIEIMISELDKDTSLGQSMQKLFKNVQAVDKITEDMYILCVRVGDIEPDESSGTGYCIFCGHEVYVSDSTYKILPDDIQAKIVCNACVLKEVIKNNGRVQNNNDAGKAEGTGFK